MQPRRHEGTRSFAPGSSFVSSCLRGALLMVACAVPLAAQQPTFRSTTRLIVQTVTVKDKDGRPVEGLTAKDFVVTEDGEPQTISFVDFQRLDTGPITGAPSQSPAAPAESRPAAQAPEGRIAAPARPGELQYRGRRLLVLYFDVSAMPPT